MDDGGPLECNGTLTGLIPKVYTCGEQLSVYVDVFQNKQWILDNLGLDLGSIDPDPGTGSQLQISSIVLMMLSLLWGFINNV